MEKILDKLFNSKVHDADSLATILQDYLRAYPKEEFSIQFFISNNIYRVQIWRTK